MTFANLCLILGIVLIVCTAAACVTYGVVNMPSDPLEKAALKSKVRLAGTLPMLAGIGLVIYGWKKSDRK